MPRTKGSLNKKARSEHRYIVTLTNPFDDDYVSSMTFPTIAEMTNFLSSKGFDICERSIARYVAREVPSPLCFNFEKTTISN